MMITVADQFAGGGGASTGIIQAYQAHGQKVKLTAINHWRVAVESHRLNHPTVRHYCASLDSLNPLDLYKEGELDFLWSSPECTHHSRARGGRPMSDQSRSTAHCVTRWAEALRPNNIVVENVKEFEGWGPIGVDKRPLKSRKGELFSAWINMLRASGYKVEWRILCAADFGDPTTRERLVIQAVRGHRQIHWPKATHGITDLFGYKKPWKKADGIIDWKLPLQSWKGRNLATATVGKIQHGISRHAGNPFLIEYYGNGKSQPLSKPLPTVTCKDRFALVTPDGGYRMLSVREYARAMGFPDDYNFCGTKADQVKQIGNSVCVGMSRALVNCIIGEHPRGT